MRAAMKLLLVEDEKRMAEALLELLRHENYEADWCADGISGTEAIESGIYDLVILDVMLPKRSGIDVTRQVRAEGIRVPILMLTAKSELEDKVAGLDCGADDYLTKPFLSQELLARIRALGRRVLGSPDDQLSYGDIALSQRNCLLSCKATGQSVRLSEKEYHILEYLLVNQGQVLSREQFALKVWGYESDAEYNNVEVYLSFVRKKLAFVGSSVTIKAVRGLGYELRYAEA